jgi:hypothetical protein
MSLVKTTRSDPPPALTSKPEMAGALQVSSFDLSSGWEQMSPPASREAAEKIRYSRPSALSEMRKESLLLLPVRSSVSGPGSA